MRATQTRTVVMLLIHCSFSGVLSHLSLPPLHDMNKELSFLSAAAIFNQWINVSTFVGI